METTVLIWNRHEAALRCVVLKSWINTSRYLSRPCGCAARARLLGSTAPAPRCVGPGRPTGHTGRGRRGKRQWCRFSAPRRQSLGVFGGCGCLTWCFQAWDCDIVWMHIPPNFCTCLCYNSRALLAAARRGFFRAPQMARKHSPEDTGRRIGDEAQGVNFSWFSATFSLLLGDLVWRRGPFQVTALIHSVSPRKKKPNWNWRSAWGICLQHSWDLELLTQLERGCL